MEDERTRPTPRTSASVPVRCAVIPCRSDGPLPGARRSDGPPTHGSLVLTGPAAAFDRRTLLLVALLTSCAKVPETTADSRPSPSKKASEHRGSDVRVALPSVLDASPNAPTADARILDATPKSPDVESGAGSVRDATATT